MLQKKFQKVAAKPENPKWDDLIRREVSLYQRKDDTRSDFIRDYNRILHCLAYRRLKHKTQIFFAPENDHVCTRIEHVNHVTAISHTIASKLGLNTDLTSAIAIGHDIGHTPFGHEGEKTLGKIAKQEIQGNFWHEKNSLWFADCIETIPNEDDNYINLTLTYAVRDGLICHCGEIDDESLIPRQAAIDLRQIKKLGEVQPYTWEACVVKIADNIAYLGRDMEDALRLGIITKWRFHRELIGIFPKFDRKLLTTTSREINNTTLIHSFVTNLCEISNPEKGLRLSEWHLELMKALRIISKDLIYESPRLEYSKLRARLIIYSIFKVLSSIHRRGITIDEIKEKLDPYPLLKEYFPNWLVKLTNIDETRKDELRFRNKTVYNIQIKTKYKKAIIDFIAAMTDNFAIRVFDELTRFG